MRSRLAREARLFVAALQFMTRLPTPQVAFAPDWLARGAKYFPLVGILVGGVAAAVLVVADRVWPGPIPAILAVLAAILLTGALHEDGLADAADGVGGRTREARLAIMKDSGMGVFGALALGLCLALRVSALAGLPMLTAAAALVGAHAAGRLAPVIVMAASRYAGDLAVAKAPPGPGRPTGTDLAVAVTFALAPSLLLEPGSALTAFLLGGVAASWVGWRLCRNLGGYTGDVLGATVAVGETAFLMGAALAIGG